MGVRNFMNIRDFRKSEILALFDQAEMLKGMLKKGQEHRLLSGKTLSMIFQKPSNRTRISFEIGMVQLGGYALNISDNEIKMGVRESIADVARTMSRYTDLIMLRVFKHADLKEFVHYAEVPVINGLSDLCHPCQALADMLTVKEQLKQLHGLKFVYIGDGNNVCYSLKEICSVLGLEFIVSCPDGYEPLKSGAPYTLVRDPQKAVLGADVIYTDVWISMGQEKEKEKRLKDFQGYTVNQDLMNKANDKAIFLHCLPAHRNEEVTDEVLEGKHSKVFEQAENRLHAQKAILTYLGGKM